MQEEFSSVSNFNLCKSTKDEIRRLELAWNMRIELDTKEVQRYERQMMEVQETLGRVSAGEQHRGGKKILMITEKKN